jgi:hypothetical protein
MVYGRDIGSRVPQAAEWTMDGWWSCGDWCPVSGQGVLRAVWTPGRWRPRQEGPTSLPQEVGLHYHQLRCRRGGLKVCGRLPVN